MHSSFLYFWQQRGENDPQIHIKGLYFPVDWMKTTFLKALTTVWIIPWGPDGCIPLQFILKDEQSTETLLPSPPTVSREVTMFTSWVSSCCCCCCSQCQLSENICFVKKHWCTLKHTYMLQETRSSRFMLFIIIHIRDIIILQNLPPYKNKMNMILTNHH